MKKILVLLLTLIIFTGCSNTTSKKEENNILQITAAMTSIGAVDEAFDKQKLSYEFTISNKGNLPIFEESIKIILTDWINEKQIVNKIEETRFNEENIIVKGYVIFNTKDMSKREIEEKEPFIEGIKIRTESDDEEIFIKN